MVEINVHQIPHVKEVKFVIVKLVGVLKKLENLEKKKCLEEEVTLHPLQLQHRHA